MIHIRKVKEDTFFINDKRVLIIEDKPVYLDSCTQSEIDMFEGVYKTFNK